MMKRSLMEAKAKTQTMGKSQSAGCIRKPRQKQGDKLPSIKKRYGSGVVSSWQKGPIDMPKVNLNSICVAFKNYSLILFGFST
jgi:hypothetical protein